jgi:aminotransferase
MYVWVPLPDGVGSLEFQRRALEGAGVVTLPSRAFGQQDDFFRIALTTGVPRLVEATERLGKVLAAV